jgi:hypothetical protein
MALAPMISKDELINGFTKQEALVKQQLTFLNNEESIPGFY